MIAWLLAAGVQAAPVLLPEPDPRARCIAEAQREAGVDGPPAPVVLPAQAERIAIVIGVPCHDSPEIPSLAYSTRDALRVAEVLDEGGYATIRLTTTVAAAELEAALRAATAALAPDGLLVVYFSGHGVLRLEGGKLRRYLVFSDTDLGDVGGTAVAAMHLEDRVSRIPAASRVVLQDTCYAARPQQGGKSVVMPGAGTRAKGIAPLEGNLALRPGDQRLYASRFYEQALETTEHRGSVYTHHLLDAVARPEAADLDGDGCVGSLEAHAWAAARTTTERGGFQTPQLWSSHLDNVPLVCGAAGTRAVVVAPAEGDWLVALRDRDGALQRTGTGSVPPGRYQLDVDRLKTTAAGALQPLPRYRGAVRLDAGDWLDVMERVEAGAPFVVGAVAATADDLGRGVESGLGFRAWRAGRDLGHGRLAWGGAADLVPRRATRSGACTRFHGGRATARAGWWWSVPDVLAAGPIAGLGATWRTPYDACTADAVALQGSAAPGALAGGHAHLTIGAVALSLEAGANGVLVERSARRAGQITPWALIGLGASL